MAVEVTVAGGEDEHVDPEEAESLNAAIVSSFVDGRWMEATKSPVKHHYQKQSVQLLQSRRNWWCV